MIIKNNSSSLIITLSFLLVIPFVQKQWFNLYLFNNNVVSIYSILYFLSGIICPILICLNSLNYFTYYKFNNNSISSKKIIKGKTLLFLVAINLLSLSYLIVDYFYLGFDFISNLFLEGIKFQLSVFQLNFLIFFIAIFLIFRKFRILFKKLILVNFILISIIIWYLQINNINIDDQFHIYKYYPLNNINLINVFNLIAIEIFYFIWSFLSYKSNLSDWAISMPIKGEMVNFLNIFIFYFFIIIFYSVFS